MPVLVVQMGHSGRTSGATGAPGEMAFTEAVGRSCLDLLHGRDGWSVRAIPADPPGSAYRGDAFVAVHADGNANPAVAGASVGYRSEPGRVLARSWRDAYVALGWTGPWHSDNYTANLSDYYGVRLAEGVGTTRACIVECGTITNPAERALLQSPEGARRAALAIGAAVGIRVEEEFMPTAAEIRDAVWDGAVLDGKTARERLKQVEGYGERVVRLQAEVEDLSVTVDALVQAASATGQVVAELRSVLLGGRVLTGRGEIVLSLEDPS